MHNNKFRKTGQQYWREIGAQRVAMLGSSKQVFLTLSKDRWPCYRKPSKLYARLAIGLRLRSFSFMLNFQRSMLNMFLL